jgi:amidase
MDSEIYFSSAKQLVERIKQKEISCVELMQIYLDRLAYINPKLNAVVQSLPLEEALRQARLADKKLVKKHTLGPLHGLPITIKDCCKVKDFIITKGSLGYHFLSKEDATVVLRLKAAGAIVFGITNVPELHIAYETDNDRYGMTLNPYDLKRTPGGSSGGEAAIIAAGGSTFGIGTDGGGSIRQPAHNTGIAGLKPTRGLIPSTGNLPYDGRGLSGTLTTYGPMARFVDDLILSLPILAGPDHCDPDAFPIAVDDPNEINLKKLRIAFYADNGVAKPNQDTLQTLMRAVNLLTPEVAQVEENRPPHLPELYKLILETFFFSGDKGVGLKLLLEQLNVKKPSYLVQEFLLLAYECEFSITELNQRLRRIDQLRTEFENFFSNYDVILCPVAATPAKYHGHSFLEGHDFSYLNLYNLLGWPALTIRCGTSFEGLPIGLQIIARPWRDMTAMCIGKKLEALLGGWQAPSLFL